MPRKQVKNQVQLEKTPRDPDALHERASEIRNVDLNDPLVVANPVLVPLYAAITTADDEAQAANVTVIAADKAAETAREVSETKTTGLSNKIDFLDAHLLALNLPPEQAMRLGGRPLQRRSYPLVAPKGAKVRWDAKRKVWRVDVEPAEGLTMCLVQYSATPAVEASWATVEGGGAKRDLPELAPGVYWLRMAHLRSKKQSPFTEPQAFTIK